MIHSLFNPALHPRGYHGRFVHTGAPDAKKAAASARKASRHEAHLQRLARRSVNGGHRGGGRRGRSTGARNRRSGGRRRNVNWSSLGMPNGDLGSGGGGGGGGADAAGAAGGAAGAGAGAAGKQPKQTPAEKEQKRREAEARKAARAALAAQHRREAAERKMANARESARKKAIAAIVRELRKREAEAKKAAAAAIRAAKQKDAADKRAAAQAAKNAKSAQAAKDAAEKAAARAAARANQGGGGGGGGRTRTSRRRPGGATRPRNMGSRATLARAWSRASTAAARNGATPPGKPVGLAAQLEAIELAADSMAKASTPRELGPHALWHKPGFKLPSYIEHVASRLIPKHGEQRGIEMAVGIIRSWASGNPTGGMKKILPSTIAAAKKALAEWESLKARAKSVKSVKDLSNEAVEQFVIELATQPGTVPVSSSNDGPRITKSAGGTKKKRSRRDVAKAMRRRTRAAAK